MNRISTTVAAVVLSLASAAQASPKVAPGAAGSFGREARKAVVSTMNRSGWLTRGLKVKTLVTDKAKQVGYVETDRGGNTKAVFMVDLQRGEASLAQPAHVQAFREAQVRGPARVSIAVAPAPRHLDAWAEAQSAVSQVSNDRIRAAMQTNLQLQYDVAARKGDERFFDTHGKTRAAAAFDEGR